MRGETTIETMTARQKDKNLNAETEDKRKKLKKEERKIRRLKRS